MDIFQNLAVDLETEGRYLFLNCIANQVQHSSDRGGGGDLRGSKLSLVQEVEGLNQFIFLSIVNDLDLQAMRERFKTVKATALLIKNIKYC